MKRRIFIKNMGLGSLVNYASSKSAKARWNASKKYDPGTSPKKTILFQGDSITDGNRSRDKDWNHSMGQGFAFLIASRLWHQYPNEGLMFYNRGISGNKLIDLEHRWQKDCIALKPDVLNILVGINDVSFVLSGQKADSVDVFHDRYKRLIERTLKQLPHVQVILNEPFVLSAGWISENFSAWQTEVLKRQEAIKQLALEYKLLHIPYQEHFNEACKRAPAEYWIWDGIHPMPAGHELMARVWLDATISMLSLKSEKD